MKDKFASQFTQDTYYTYIAIKYKYRQDKILIQFNFLYHVSRVISSEAIRNILDLKVLNISDNYTKTTIATIVAQRST